MTAVLVLPVSDCSGVFDVFGGGVVDVVWLSDEQAYVVHDPEAGRELWRRDGDRETFVARGRDIPDACGPVDLVFNAGGGKLGIGLECPGMERLVSFTPATGVYETLYDTRPTGEVTMRADGAGGYLSTRGGCWYLAAFGRARTDMLEAVSRFTCERGGSAKAPHLLPNGDLVFVGSETLIEPPQNDDNQVWHVYVLGPNDAAPRRVGPDLVGFPEMDVTPDGRTAIVGVSQEHRGILVKIDLASGEHERLVKRSGWVSSPSVSPDGRKVMYIEDLDSIAVESL